MLKKFMAIAVFCLMALFSTTAGNLFENYFVFFFIFPKKKGEWYFQNSANPYPIQKRIFSARNQVKTEKPRHYLLRQTPDFNTARIFYAGRR